MTTQELEQKFTKYLYGKRHNPIAVRVRSLYEEMDILSITSCDYLYEYELKISVGDFRNDQKKIEKHKKLCNKKRFDKPNYFYYVIPKGLISIDEIPEYAGLIIVSDEIEIIKQAPILHKRKVNYKIMKSIAKNLTDRVLSDGIFWQKKNYSQPEGNYPEWICPDCAEKYHFSHRDDLETLHQGECSICKEIKIVAPDRYYYYPRLAI